MIVHGRAGAYPASQAWLHYRRGAAAAAAVVPLGGLTALLGGVDLIRSGWGGRVVALLLVAAIAAVLLTAHRHLDAGRRYAVGARSERRTARALRRSGSVALVHGAQVGAGGDVDHVAVGPWVVVVETKTGRGPVLFGPDGVQVNGRRLRSDPVEQVSRQAAAVGRQFGVRAEAVVCITDMNGPVQVHRGVQVCSLADLPRVVARSPRLLTETQAAQVAQTLSCGPAQAPERKLAAGARDRTTGMPASAPVRSSAPAIRPAPSSPGVPAAPPTRPPASPAAPPPVLPPLRPPTS